MNRLLEQIFKFGIVGGIAFVIDYGLLYICTEWFGIYVMLSSVISFSISVLFNYIASVLWVFDTNKEKSKVRNFIFFILLSVLGLGINQVIMWIGIQMDYYYMIVKLLATVIVMIFNFITRKMFLE